MRLAWTDERTKQAQEMWYDSYSLEQIGKEIGYSTATVSAKLRDAGEDMVSYGSVSRKGLEAEGSKPRRMGEALAHHKEVTTEQIMYQPTMHSERTINALLDNDMAETREEAVAMLVEAGSRDPVVVQATNLEAKIRDQRAALKLAITEGQG